jgi:hypothetical protein
MPPPYKRKTSDKSQPPTEHPKPYQSPLWSHFGLIQKLRRRRESWKKIADHLSQAHQLKVSHKTIQRFFSRAVDPKTGRPKPAPLGFPSTTSKEIIDEPQKQSSRERLRAEAASIQKETEERERKWTFGSPYHDNT